MITTMPGPEWFEIRAERIKLVGEKIDRLDHEPMTLSGQHLLLGAYATEIAKLYVELCGWKDRDWLHPEERERIRPRPDTSISEESS